MAPDGYLPSGYPPSGYLYGVLADGARSFRHRSRVRQLLGMPEDTGIRVSFAPIAPHGGFTYLRYLPGTGEPYLPAEGFVDTSHWLDNTADDVVAPRPAVTIRDGWPPVTVDTPDGPRGSAAGRTPRRGEPIRSGQAAVDRSAPPPELTPTPSADESPSADATSAVSTPAFESAFEPACDPTPALDIEGAAPGVAVVIPGITTRSERHRSEGGQPGSADPQPGAERTNPSRTNPSRTNPSRTNPSRTNPSRTNPSQPVTGRLGTGAPSAASSGGQVPPRWSGGQVPSGNVDRPRQEKPVHGAGRPSAGGEDGDADTAAAGPPALAGSSGGGGGRADRSGPMAAQPAAGWRPARVPGRAASAARPPVPDMQPAEPGAPPDTDWPVSGPTAVRRSPSASRRPASGGRESAPRTVDSPHRPATAHRPAAPGTTPQVTEVSVPAPQVVVVREPVPTTATPVAFWERRHLSRLATRILR